MKSITMLTAIVSSLMLGGGLVADTIYVAQDGSGDYTDIQSAVDASSEGDEIIVAPGTYTSEGGDWQSHVFSFPGPGVTVRASGSPEETIIDAQGLSACITVWGDVSGPTTPYVIEGFTLTGATYSGLNLSGFDELVEVRNCIIRDIEPTQPWDSTYGVSGQAASLKMVGCLLSNIQGYAVDAKPGTSLELTDCVIEDIQQEDYTGVVQVWMGCHPVITGCTWRNNTGIGLNIMSYNSAAISDCEITDSTGRPLSMSLNESEESLVIQGTIISGNEGGINVSGGSGSSVTIEDCVITQNSGGLDVSCGSVAIMNTNMTSNDSSRLLYLGPGDIELSQARFESNQLTDSVIFYANGDVSSGSLKIDKCLFIGNVSEFGYPVIFNNSWSGSVIEVNGSVFCANQPNNDIGDPWTGEGNAFEETCADLDSDGDGVSDDIDNCELFNPSQADCDGNGVGDVCDIADGTHPDCDGNDVPDVCQSDCDGDGLIDACAINNGAIDINPQDGVPDLCQGVPTGACCVNGACLQATEASCLLAGGEHAGVGSPCDTFECDGFEPCPGDADGDGQVGVNDILVVIAQYGVTCP